MKKSTIYKPGRSKGNLIPPSYNGNLPSSVKIHIPSHQQKELRINIAYEILFPF